MLCNKQHNKHYIGNGEKVVDETTTTIQSRTDYRIIVLVYQTFINLSV